MPKADPKYLDPKLEERWEKIIALKLEVYKELEAVRARKEIGSSIEALVEIGTQGREWAKDAVEMLPMVFIVAQVKLVAGDQIVVKRAPGVKCERCWIVKEDVGRNSAHPTLCGRCGKLV